MGALKKYLVYAIILAILSAAAVFLNELRMTREYAEHPEFAVKTAPQPAAASREEFKKPAQSGLMDSSELAWMLRERIILDVWERIIPPDGAEREGYNARVREYNNLAVAIEYRESAMNSAVSLVERSKGEIVRSAEDEAMSIVMPENVKKDAGASAAWRVQQYLKLLGYYAGDITGKEDRKTTDAVKTFEIRTDSEPTGKIDESLAKELREIWISRNIPVSVGFGGQ